MNGRPRAHHEDPMRALHSPMLQYGISVTANLHVELDSSHDDKIDLHDLCIQPDSTIRS